MVPRRLYLLRHAETEWSASGRHTSRTDVPLTDDGERHAVHAGELLARLRDRDLRGTGARGGEARPPIAWSSPRRRAVQTAKLAGLPPPVIVDELAEWDYGRYEGLTTAQIRKSVPDWTVWTHPCPDGETAAQVSARADRVLARVSELPGDDDLVLVGHGHFSRVLAARWIGLPATSGVHFALDAGGLMALGDERGAPRLDHVNLLAVD